MIDYNNIRNGKNCVIWTRVSTKYQEDNGGSIATQKEMCEKYAKANGYCIRGYYGGEHESAKTPGKLVTAMSNYVKRDKSIAVILISEFDRFSRVLWQATKMLEDMRHLGIVVIATKFGIDTRTKEGMMMAQHTLSMAQWDNQNRTDKFVGGRADCLRSGAWCEKAPLGYSKDGKSRKTYCYLNEEGRQIRNAFKWKLQGCSNLEILGKLSARGVDISKQTLHKILVNPFYAGKIVHKLINYEMVDGNIEPAVTYSDFLKVQDILSGKTGQYVHSKQKPNLPLTKYVICATDGTPFTSYTKAKRTKTTCHYYDYYKCNKNGCKTNVSAKEMHDKYEILLSKYNLSQEQLSRFEIILRGLIESYSEESISQTKTLRKRLTEIEKDIKDSKLRYASGKIDDDTFETAMKEFNDRRDIVLLELEKWDSNLSNPEGQIPIVISTASNISTLWHEGNLDTKRQIQNLIFPNGVLWDREICNYRTISRNRIFDIMESVSGTYKQRTEAETSTSVPSCG